MKAVPDDPTFRNDAQNSLRRYPAPGADSIDLTDHHARVERTSGMPHAPASTTAVDVIRHIEAVADTTNDHDNVTTETVPVSDQDLARKVMLLLGRSKDVPFEGISTEIHNGCVTLLGSVASTAASQGIEQEVQRLSGVHSVINRISIQEIQQ